MILKRRILVPDGKWGLTVSADQTARVWDVGHGEVSFGEPVWHAFNGHTGTAITVTMRSGPDSKYILALSTDETARMWDISWLKHPLAPVPEWVRKRATAAAGMEFDADGSLRVIAGDVCRETMPGRTAGAANDWATLWRWLAMPALTRPFTPGGHDSRACRSRQQERDIWEQEEPRSGHPV